MSGVEALMATKIAGDLTLGTALTVGGLATTAVGAISSGRQQAAASEFNARQAENAAAASRLTAGIEEDRHRRRTAQLLSSQRVAAGASGVTMEGSPLLVMADAAADSEYDALLIRYGGEIGAEKAMAQAALDRMQGRAARSGSYFKAGSSLLSGASLLGGRPSRNRTLLTDDEE